MNKDNRVVGISQEHINLYLNHEAKPEELARIKGLHGIIYLIFNTINNKGYIGKTIATFNRRYAGGKWWKKIANEAFNPLLCRAADKYGITQFKIFILESNIPCQQLIRKREKYWAKLLDTYVPNGYNIRECGEGGIFYGAIKRIIKEKLAKRKGKIYNLKNINTGEIIEIQNLSKWATEKNLKINSLRKLIQGRRKTYTDFCLPETECPLTPKERRAFIRRKTRKTYLFKRIYDDIIIEIKNLPLFCEENNMNYSAMTSLSAGRINHSQGYCRIDSNINDIKKKLNFKHFTLLNPNNKIVLVEKDICEFCKNNGLDLSALHHVIKGEYKHHKGWKVIKWGDETILNISNL